MQKSLDFKFQPGRDKNLLFSQSMSSQKKCIERTVTEFGRVGWLLCWYLKKMVVEVSEVAQLSISSIICKIDSHSHCNCGIFMNQICIEIIQPEVVFIDLNYKHPMINYRRVICWNVVQNYLQVRLRYIYKLMFSIT